MTFTYPAYNVKVSGQICGLGKVSHAELAMASGELSKPEIITFLTDFIGKMFAHLMDGAVVDLCMDCRHMDEMLEAIEVNGLSLFNLCAWNKSNGGIGSLYRSKHQLVFIAKKGGW